MTIVYLLEQIEIFGLGSTSRASDIRIILSLILNGVFVAISVMIIYRVGGELGYVIGFLAYLASKNPLFSCGLKAPFKVVNEQLERQKEHADIVFNGLNGTVPVKNSGKSCNVLPVVKTLIEAILVCGMIFMVFRQAELLDFPLMAMICMLISVVLWVTSALGNRRKFRSFACPSWSCFAYFNIVALIMLKVILAATISSISMLAISKQCMIVDKFNEPKRSAPTNECIEYNHRTFEEQIIVDTILACLIFRVFQRAFRNPIACSFELGLSIVSIQGHFGLMNNWGSLEWQTLFTGFMVNHFLLHRLWVFGNKLVYVMVSI